MYKSSMSPRGSALLLRFLVSAGSIAPPNMTNLLVSQSLIIGDGWSIRLFLSLGKSLVVGLGKRLALTLLAVLNSRESSVSFPVV